jgi:uncharacterized protein (TIGR01777 family)
MNFLITGGTGFIGTALCDHLLAHNHQLTVKTRQQKLTNKRITLITSLAQLTGDEAFDVVINLAGEPIADKRWSKQQKREIIDSRLNVTSDLIQYFKRAKHLPEVFISGSAIGYYDGQLGEQNVDEGGQKGTGFSSAVCERWEAKALEAQNLGIRTCLLRTGIVLGREGGALHKMLPAFKLGLGGKLGSGNQWMPWIHIDDIIGIIEYLINNRALMGVFNCTAPEPVTNKIFTVALGQALKRPTVMSVPSFFLTLALGDMGNELLLNGSKIVPQKLLNNGYRFKNLTIEQALNDLV